MTDDDPSDAHVGRHLLDEGMGPGSSLAHLYRGEVHRMKFWRERLDRTTNWAVTVLAAVVTWAFSSPDHPHYLLLGGGITVGIFLSIEARRYRGYDIWRSRVRVLQENVWAHGLDPASELVDHDWRERLAADYRRPRKKISYSEALAHRLRRVYLPLLSVLVAAWGIRVTAMATVPWPESAAVGAISGLAVSAAVGGVFAALVAMAYRPRRWQAKGELREEAVGVWDD
jgi:uncharacterized membrane protein